MMFTDASTDFSLFVENALHPFQVSLENTLLSQISIYDFHNSLVNK